MTFYTSDITDTNTERLISNFLISFTITIKLTNIFKLLLFNVTRKKIISLI